MSHRSNASFPGGLFVFCAIAFLVYLGFREIPKLTADWRSQMDAQRWAELRKAVVIAGTPLAEHPEDQATDYTAESARLLALYNNRALNFDNAELGKNWAQIETNSSAGLALLHEIGYIDRVKPSGYLILANALQNDDQGNQAAWDEIVQRGASEMEESDLQEQFREAARRLDDAIGGLQMIAEALSHTEIPSAVSVQYLPSWDGTYRGDLLELQNTSGDAFQNAIVATTVHMRSGSSKTHVHYVDQWPAGSTMKAIYTYLSADYATPQTAGDPQQVDVAVYLPSGTARSTYVLTPEVWEKAVASYTSSLTFNGNYLGPYADSDQSYHAGFKFQFGGLPTLPVTGVDVRFTSDSDSTTREYMWSPDRKLQSETEYPIRSEALDGPTPDHIDLILSFSETDYTQRVHAY